MLWREKSRGKQRRGEALALLSVTRNFNYFAMFMMLLLSLL